MLILNILNIIIGIIGLFIIILCIWRLSSHHYSIPCPSWLAWLVERDNPFVKICHAANIIQHADVQIGMVVLDAGCGPGRITIPLARKIGPLGQVIAMDIQADMIRRTHEKAKAANLTNITFLQAGLGEGRLEHNKFDRILLVSVLGEVPKRDVALKEIFDALKPEGILSVTETIFDPHFQSCTKVLQLAQGVGFIKKEKFGNWFAYTLNLKKF